MENILPRVLVKVSRLEDKSVWIIGTLDDRNAKGLSLIGAEYVCNDPEEPREMTIEWGVIIEWSTLTIMPNGYNSLEA